MTLFSKLPTNSQDANIILEAIKADTIEDTPNGFQYHTVSFVQNSRRAAACLGKEFYPATASAFYDSIFNLVCRESMNGVLGPVDIIEVNKMINHYRSDETVEKYDRFNETCSEERILESLFDDLVIVGDLKFSIVDSASGSIYFLRMVFKACYMSRYSIVDIVEFMRLAMKYLFDRPSIGLTTTKV